MIRTVSWNCNGLKKSEKLLNFLRKSLTNIKKNCFYIACIQEIKLNALTNDHKTVIKNYGLEYHFQPATKRSGGLLTMWNHGENSILIATNETCLITEFPKMSLTLVNTYVRTIDYKEACEQLFTATSQLSTSSKIVMIGDFNAYKNPIKDRISNKMGPLDNHLKIFKI